MEVLMPVHIFFGDLVGTVGAAVFDDDHFIGNILLFHETVDLPKGVGQALFFVMGRDDDG
jgi:hypothetical protein